MVKGSTFTNFWDHPKAFECRQISLITSFNRTIKPVMKQYGNANYYKLWCILVHTNRKYGLSLLLTFGFVSISVSIKSCFAFYKQNMRW